MIQDPGDVIFRDPNANEGKGALSAGREAGADRGRVLLVEDNVVNRRVAVEMLRMAGLAVDTAADGETAISALERIPYDAVLMDIQMPGMDGYETTRRIREKSAHRTVPIIAMTAHAMKSARARCIAAGMNDYLTKPIDAAVLFSVLARWVPSIGLHPTGSLLPRPDPPAGIDLPTALDHLGGSRRLLWQLLREFSVEHAGDGLFIRAALDRGDRPTAMRTANALAAIGETLGARGLSRIADHLETLLREGNTSDLSTTLDALDGALTLVCDTGRRGPRS